MVNRVTLIGNLGRDPEVRTLDNGAKVATFSVATTESYKDKNDTWQNQTEWHNIVAWRYLAEKAERELKKGNSVYIEGKITTRKYADKDGVERTTTEIVASEIRSLERKEPKPTPVDNGQGYTTQRDAPKQAESPDSDSINLPVDMGDLPF